MGKVNVVIIDATGNKEQKVGLPDDIKCGIIMVKLIEKIKLPSVGPDGNPISYKFIHKVTGRQLLESQTLGEAGIKDGDVLRLQPEITAGSTKVCPRCGSVELADAKFCGKCGGALDGVPAAPQQPAAPVYPNYAPAQQYAPVQQQYVPQINPTAAATAVVAKVKGKGACTWGALFGWLSVIFGLIMMTLDTGSWESNLSYGGDAYTGIQNAAAQSANNIMALAEIAKTGFGFMLISFGLFMVCFFSVKKKQLKAERG